MILTVRIEPLQQVRVAALGSDMRQRLQRVLGQSLHVGVATFLDFSACSVDLVFVHAFLGLLRVTAPSSSEDS